MTLLIDEGFENWNVNGISVFTSGSGSFTIDEVSKRSGVYGGDMYMPAYGNGRTYVYKTMPSSYGTATFDLYFKIAVGTMANNSFMSLAAIYNIYQSFLLWVNIKKTTGDVFLEVRSYGLPNEDITSHPILPDTWYRVTLICKTSSVDGYYKVYIDSEEVYNESDDLSGAENAKGFAIGMESSIVTFTSPLTVYFDDMKFYDSDEKPEPPPPSYVKLDGEYYNIIAWKEEQSCSPAIRDVPMRSEGAYVDVGTFLLRARILNIILRLSDSEKTTIQTIFDGNSGITIVAKIDGDTNEWYYYNVWLIKKPIIYEYKSIGGSNLREWRAELEFKVASFEYA